MEVMFDRVAGLDVGKETVTVCLRTPGPQRWAAQRDADVQNDNRVVAGDAGLAGRGRGEHRGDGVHVGVLEATVLLPRRGHGGVAAERGAHEGGARAGRAMFGTRNGSRSCWSTACWRRRSCRHRRSAGCGC